MSRSSDVHKVAVLGAGVMGAQIAAHCANAGIPVVLFDLPGRESANEIGQKAVAQLKKMEPAPLGLRGLADAIEIANYQDDLSKLADCDLIIEAIAEKIEWKRDLYHKIAPHIAATAAIASNTSGLSINALAECLPDALRSRFCGIHFFNPPRYMLLVELIAANSTDPQLLDRIETWATSRLGKRIVRAKDTPNFIANRIGVFMMIAVAYHTERLGLGFDAVDAVTGSLIGRPKSASYRLMDVVGLDTLAHVIATLAREAGDDGWSAHYRVPEWLNRLIAAGALGQKAKAGVYRKQGKTIEVIDLASGDYRAADGKADAAVVDLLKIKEPGERMAKLRSSSLPQAQLIWSIYRDAFHYSACQLEAIATSARDIDEAMRWGFGWSEGPFESWQKAGWQSIVTAVREDIAAGRAMSTRPLPDWVDRVTAAHTPAGSWSPSQGQYLPRSPLPVQERQLVPPRLDGESSAEIGTTVWSNASVRLWTHPSAADVLIWSMTSRVHLVGADALAAIDEAVSRAEADYAALVIWHEAPFALGANLKEMAPLLLVGNVKGIADHVRAFQQAMLRLKYARVPVVAAVSGMALGGGCEMMLHAHARVAAFESYIGLVEAGVGLIPAGGGCKETALRAARWAARCQANDPFPYLERSFMSLAMAKTSKSGLEAHEMGYLADHDTILFNADELLYAALHVARGRAAAGWVPPRRGERVKVAGRTGIANFDMQLVNMQDGGFISAHDFRVAHGIARAICGGDVDSGVAVDEAWLLDLEHSIFMDLLLSEPTQARIRHTLETGKPLRN